MRIAAEKDLRQFLFLSLFLRTVTVTAFLLFCHDAFSRKAASPLCDTKWVRV